MTNSTDAPFTCRSCGASGVQVVLSLGKTPLANALLQFEQLNQIEQWYPLELAFCSNCTLVQITETVPPEQLFRHYAYYSSFSDTVLAHAGSLAARMMRERQLCGDSLVVEIASNDGYLLQNYQQAGVPVLGIEPATNIAAFAQTERNIPTRCVFFDEQVARHLRVEGKRADVIHAHNVLAHVAALHSVVEGIRLLLKDNGVAVIEVPYVKEMLDRCEFDTIYHEHLCYFSLTALHNLFNQHGLMLQDVERVPIHGGSLRVFVGLRSDQARPAPGVMALLNEEQSWGVNRVAPYLQLSQRVESLAGSLRSVLIGLKQQGFSIVGYGASAKGSTLLNYCGIGEELLDFVVDRSTVKQGYYTPGTHLPIYAPDKLLERMPDYVVLLTWNFVDEIVEQQAEYRRRGGKFIIPIPEVSIVEQ